MSKLRCHISISLDGFVAGPNQSQENPLGGGGERLQNWVVPLAAWRQAHGRQGGEVNASARMSRNHARTSALGLWAGSRDVVLWGGGQVVQQYLAAGLLDELELHLVPVLLGDGARIFGSLGDAAVQLEQVRAVEAPGVTHLKYRVVR
jgi:riboflavin biosynthesis pyrimidine reductase